MLAYVWLSYSFVRSFPEGWKLPWLYSLEHLVRWRGLQKYIAGCSITAVLLYLHKAKLYQAPFFCESILILLITAQQKVLQYSPLA